MARVGWVLPFIDGRRVHGDNVYTINDYYHTCQASVGHTLVSSQKNGLQGRVRASPLVVQAVGVHFGELQVLVSLDWNKRVSYAQARREQVEFPDRHQREKGDKCLHQRERVQEVVVERAEREPAIVHTNGVHVIERLRATKYHDSAPHSRNPPRPSTYGT